MRECMAWQGVVRPGEVDGLREPGAYVRHAVRPLHGARTAGPKGHVQATPAPLYNPER